MARIQPGSDWKRMSTEKKLLHEEDPREIALEDPRKSIVAN